jgi:drug/metabolite transporter (DMT)-like permease
VLAAVVFGEHLGRRLLAGAGLVTVAGIVLTWEPGASIDVGAVLIVAACACWGLDNGVTASIEQLSPEHVVALKGVVAGGANLLIGLLVAGWGSATGAPDIIWALLVGAAGYGWSITLWVKGARDLGAARGQVIFATAPFIGAAIAWTWLGEPVDRWQLVAVALAAAGVAISIDSAHDHHHRHAELSHDHEHVHDDGHHDHAHADGFTGRHSHPHVHAAVVHAHPHVPDLHHRHDH